LGLNFYSQSCGFEPAALKLTLGETVRVLFTNKEIVSLLIIITNIAIIIHSLYKVYPKGMKNLAYSKLGCPGKTLF
jgi:hypothetical protein